MTDPKKPTKTKDGTPKLVPLFVHEAHAAKLKAETAEAVARTRSTDVETEVAMLNLSISQVQHGELLRSHAYNEASDERQHIYRFAGAVDAGSAAKCMDTLNRWSRMEPGCAIEIVFFSPGGSVTDGMALYDTIQLLRAADHVITTTCIGMAASMGGILLQAGDVRRMTSESWVLIHEVSASAMGSMGEITDRVEWLKRIQERILAIFAAKSKASGAKKPLTAAEFKKRWARTDWWLDSDQCLEHGIVDVVI